MDLRTWIRDVPDFPRPGILFRDLTPLLAHGPALTTAVDRLAEQVTVFAGGGRAGTTMIAAIESRGFIFGAAVAAKLGVGFVPLRKPGKLPFRTRQWRYDLEYGSDGLEIHEDALGPGARVVIVDDLLATGGTAGAAIRLVRELGAEVLGAAFVIELAGLAGRERLGGVPVAALITYA